jgi:hypothetical protein
LKDIAVEAIIPGGNADVINVTGFPVDENGSYTVLAVNDTATIDALVANESVSIPGADEVAIAAGYVLTTPAFGLLLTEDDNRSIVTQASVKVVHAAPLAGTVDVFVTAAGQFSVAEVEGGLAGTPLLDDFMFADITAYVAVAPANYDIRVVASGAVAINVENANLAAGSVSTVIARQPIDSGTPDDFNVILLSN